MPSSSVSQGRRASALLHSSHEAITAMILVPGIERLVSGLRAKDEIVFRHSERTAYYAYLIGLALGLKGGQLAALQKGGVLHDLGKLMVPQAILNKPGRLTPEEWEIMRNHPAEGHAQLAGRIEPAALEIVRYHHERYDGHGYPGLLRGNDIPILARIVSVADAFDAMTSHRHPYRSPVPPSEACEEIIRNAGTQFDPVVVNAFCSVYDDIVETHHTVNGQTATSRLWEGTAPRIPVPVLASDPALMA